MFKSLIDNDKFTIEYIILTINMKCYLPKEYF